MQPLFDEPTVEMIEELCRVASKHNTMLSFRQVVDNKRIQELIRGSNLQGCGAMKAGEDVKIVDIHPPSHKQYIDF